MYGENMYGEVNMPAPESGSAAAGGGCSYGTDGAGAGGDAWTGGNTEEKRSQAGQMCAAGPAPYTWTNYVNGMGEQTGVPVFVPVRRRGVRLEAMMDHFGWYGLGCILYGVLFTICLYPGFGGISVPVLSVATMAGLLWILQRMEIETGKDVLFYFTAWLALSISNCLTGSRLLTAFNTIGLLLLVLSFLLSHFCNTEGWGFAKYVLQILRAPFAAAAYWGCFFCSMKRHMEGREKEHSSAGKYIWIGIAVSVPVLLVVLCLLASADAVFGHLLGEMLGAIRFPAHFFYLCLLLLTGSIGVYGLIAYFSERGEKEKAFAAEERQKWEPLIGITFLSVLTVVYLIFSSIQIFYLFLENGALPQGQTYSAYAREGFFQLLLVCLINLTILLICICWFREHRILKALLTVFSVCTVIMDASSAMRMILYVQACQLTFLRLLVLWALAVIDLLLVGCIITVYRVRFPLFRYMMTAVTVCYLIFSLAKPDYVIAKYNLTHDNGSLDIRYLCSLSSDAVPAMKEAGMLGELSAYPRKLDQKLERYETMGIRNFNFSVYRAGKILLQYEKEADEK